MYSIFFFRNKWNATRKIGNQLDTSEIRTEVNTYEILGSEDNF